jgi:membrane protease YdiL (CAAX protease family)
MHPVMNKSEHCVRAGIRITIYIIIAFPIVMIGNALPLGGLEFLLTTALSFGFFWVMFRFVDHRSSIKLAGIQPDRKWWIECGWESLIAALVMGLIFIIQLLTNTVEFLGFSWDQPGTSSWLIPILVFLMQMACVGFYEELMMRSYLLPNLKEGFTIGKIDTIKATVLAVIFSSSIFGIAHGLNPNVTFFSLLNITLAGVMLAVPYLITGRLAYSVGIHFAWNFFQGGIFGFRVSGMPIRGSLIQIQQNGEAIWTGASFGPEGGLIGTIGILLVTILSLIFIKRSGIALNLHLNFKKSYHEFEGLTKENE